MITTLSPRWSRILFPCLGQRVIDSRGWQGRHFPLISWFYYASAAWFAPRLIAVTFIGLFPAITLLLFGARNAAAYLAFALTGWILMGLVLSIVLRPRLTVHAEVPPRAAAGGTFIIRYTVTNHGRRSAYDIEIETLPFPYILEMRTRPVTVGCLRPGESCTVSGTVRALKRGRYRLQPLRWDTDFPFGLWRLGHTDWSDRTINIYPAHPPLQQLELPAGSRNRRETHVASHLAREALEFHGCREFRAGDLVRHIHPRSSARLGFPVVKEFKAEGRGRTAIVIDTWRRHPWAGSDLMRDRVVEASLSLAASVVDHLARSDRVLELLVAGPGLYQFETAGRAGFVEEVMDVLAAVEPCRKDPLSQWAPYLLDEIREIQSVILILGRWDAARARLVEALTWADAGLRTVLVEHGSRRRSDALAIPPEVLRLPVPSILRGEVIAL